MEIKQDKWKIIETDSIEDLLKYNDVNTLIVLDFDNTLVAPLKNDFGSSEWFEFLLNSVGLEIRKAGHIWADVQLHYNLNYQLMEGLQTKRVLKQLNNPDLVICTARGTKLKQVTIEIMKTQGVFSLFKTKMKDIEIGTGGLYTEGVILAQFQKKSVCILDYISKVAKKRDKLYQPNVVFIDDSKKHVIEVVHCLTQRGISCTGLYYTRYKRRHFDPLKGQLAYEKYIIGVHRKRNIKLKSKIIKLNSKTIN